MFGEEHSRWSSFQSNVTHQSSSFSQSNVTHQAAAEPELESSRVKEAALDDKLGVELRSIVEQIQVMAAGQR